MIGKVLNTLVHFNYTTKKGRKANFSVIFWPGNLWKYRGILLKAVNYFRKILHLRCLTGSWISPWNGIIAQSLLTRTFLNSTISPDFVLSFLIENMFALINCNRIFFFLIFRMLIFKITLQRLLYLQWKN